MTEKLKQHIQSMTDGQRSYFLYEIVRRNIAVLDESDRIRYNKFAVAFFQDLGTPMTYENCIKMLEMEEEVCEQSKGFTEVRLNQQSAFVFLDIFENTIQPGLREIGVDTIFNANEGTLTFNYTNKNGDSVSKVLKIGYIDRFVINARYNVTNLYGENSIETRSLLNMPLKDISEVQFRYEIGHSSTYEGNSVILDVDAVLVIPDYDHIGMEYTFENGKTCYLKWNRLFPNGYTANDLNGKNISAGSTDQYLTFRGDIESTVYIDAYDTPVSGSYFCFINQSGTALTDVKVYYDPNI